MATFKWGHEPPSIDPHSKAKLKVLRRYLRAYFDTLSADPRRDEFRLDLVDGFSGGGEFQDGADMIPGTPLIMLEEVANARERLQAGRTKPLNFDCRCYFVDVERDHTRYLKRILEDSDHDPGGYVVLDGAFEDKAGDIIREIRKRQPIAGRAIFLLDQEGWSDVQLGLVARILRDLPTAEVILTFSGETMTNFLGTKTRVRQSLERIGFSSRTIDGWLAERESVGGKALVQRMVRKDILRATEATYDTPFFIRPGVSRRALWLLHLSRHATARDVMIRCHWAERNTFEHYGPGDFGMLGWDTLLESTSIPLFNFDDMDKERMIDGLMETFPRELSTLISKNPNVSISQMRSALANGTAAPFSVLDEVVLRLVRGKELDVLTRDGRPRSRNLQNLGPSDLISLPSTPLLPGLSRIRRR